jgi:uncharacterized iron-regulated protein
MYKICNGNIRNNYYNHCIALAIKVKDIKRPEGVEITSPTENDLVAKAVPALSEEELKKMEEAGSAQADLSKIESAKKKKEDEDAAADGAEKKEEEKK